MPSTRNLIADILKQDIKNITARQSNDCLQGVWEFANANDDDLENLQLIRDVAAELAAESAAQRRYGAWQTHSFGGAA